ncbi:MAG TPA: ferritin-like domain-containing protein [Steroidobacteraceae bacterium]|nr:ferritin-like domain-containing protein [Steroidobacteraceae bacterium]
MKNEQQSKPSDLSDVQTLRRRARQHVENGAVTPSYAADRVTVLRLLNEALATELVCTLRYRRHYYMADGVQAESVKQEFLEHAEEEQRHAHALAQRIVQLDGMPNFDPHGLAERSHAEYVECNSLDEMIRENLVAERVAIESYKEMITYLGHDDPTTRRLLESILAAEEEHAEDLSSLLRDVAPRLGATSSLQKTRGAVIPEMSGETEISGANHGEGDPESASRFNDAQRRFVDSTRGKKKILGGTNVHSDDAAELKEAERLGKQRAKGDPCTPPTAPPLNR